jgi:hypothetical protein
MRHLDAAAMRELEAREPAAVAYFASHLASPCEACETFLVTHADALDGRTDALLLALAPERPQATGAPEVPLRATPKRRRFTPPPGRYWGWMAGALAASVLMAVLVPRVKGPASTPDSEWNGQKGPGRISLELAVVARATDGGLRRLDPGDAVAPDEVLLLRYHATESGTALLYQLRGGGAPELLGRFPLEAGTHDLEGPEGLAGVSLETDEGPLTVALVAFAPGEAATEEDARSVLASEGTPEARPGAHARFDVRVRSGQTRAP